MTNAMIEKQLQFLNRLAKSIEEQKERLSNGLPMDMIFDAWNKSDIVSIIQGVIEDKGIEMSEKNIDDVVCKFCNDNMIQDANNALNYDDIQNYFYEVLV